MSREPNLAAETELDLGSPSTGLLSFYDRLRAKVLRETERRGGRWSERAVSLLMAVPDVFVLLVRLGLDRDVPEEKRRLILGALTYFVVPVDLLPEVFVGPGGFLDDLVLACAVLSRVLGPDMRQFVEKHWSGSRDLPELLQEVSSSAEVLLGRDLGGRVVSLMERRFKRAG